MLMPTDHLNAVDDDALPGVNASTFSVLWQSGNSLGSSRRGAVRSGNSLIQVRLIIRNYPGTSVCSIEAVTPPARTHAKFIRHPLLTGDYDVDAIDGLPLLASTPFTNDDDSSNDHSTITTSDLPATLKDINDAPAGSISFDGGLAPEKYTAESLGIRKRTPANSRNASEAETHELNALLPATSYASGVASTSEGTTYAASQLGTSGERRIAVTDTPTSTVTAPPSTTPATSYQPIAAAIIFDRSAAPLYLPHLDDYLASLPAPSFPRSFPPSKGKGTPMFPPMDRIAVSGKTLEDLEDNSQVAPWYRNRTSIFGSLTRWSLALTVRFLRLFAMSHH